MLLALPGIDASLIGRSEQPSARDGVLGFVQFGVGPPLKVDTDEWLASGGDVPGLIVGAVLNRLTRIGPALLVASAAGRVPCGRDPATRARHARGLRRVLDRSVRDRLDMTAVSGCQRRRAAASGGQRPSAPNEAPESAGPLGRRRLRDADAVEAERRRGELLELLGGDGARRAEDDRHTLVDGLEVEERVVRQLGGDCGSRARSRRRAA